MSEGFQGFVIFMFRIVKMKQDCVYGRIVRDCDTTLNIITLEKLKQEV